MSLLFLSALRRRFLTSYRQPLWLRKAQTPFPLLSLLLQDVRRLKSAPINRSYASPPLCFSLSFFLLLSSVPLLSFQDGMWVWDAQVDLSVQSFRAVVWKSRSTFAQPKITSNLQTGIPRSACTEIISIKFLQYSYRAAVVEIKSLYSFLEHFMVLLSPL